MVTPYIVVVIRGVDLLKTSLGQKRQEKKGLLDFV